VDRVACQARDLLQELGRETMVGDDLLAFIEVRPWPLLTHGFRMHHQVTWCASLPAIDRRAFAHPLKLCPPVKAPIKRVQTWCGIQRLCTDGGGIPQGVLAEPVEEPEAAVPTLPPRSAVMAR
jgi:hypothetical protein